MHIDDFAPILLQLASSAMEYSKSPKNSPQFVVGFFCNVFRLLNNVHPLVPLTFIFLVLAAAVWGLRGLVS